MELLKTASNIHKAFVGINASKLFSEKTGCKFFVLNDADVAGFAELRFGTVANFNGLAIFLTIGTRIGSAIFSNGKLILSTELGHVFMKNGLKPERFTSYAICKTQNLPRISGASVLTIIFCTSKNFSRPKYLYLAEAPVCVSISLKNS
ncbi:MAG TPA: ROK family protein [Bacteroidetes bacterium]|nr:ROK family protein [Bacteroidota bacterium]